MIAHFKLASLFILSAILVAFHFGCESQADRSVNSSSSGTMASAMIAAGEGYSTDRSPDMPADRIRDNRSREISRPGYPDPYKMQAMTQRMLMQIYDLQTAYRAELNSFCLNGITSGPGYRNTFDILGTIFDPLDPYYYCMISSRFTFICTATATNLDDDATTDVWTIDDTGKLICICDDTVL